jgi:hypothetical protein
VGNVSCFVGATRDTDLSSKKWSPVRAEVVGTLRLTVLHTRVWWQMGCVYLFRRTCFEGSSGFLIETAALVQELNLLELS